jgi:hypothetical protein
MTISGGLGVRGNVSVDAINFRDGTRLTTTPSSSSGASLSGYLANTILIANSSGFLSNTHNLKFYASNSTVYSSGSILLDQTVVADTVVVRNMPTQTFTSVNLGSGKETFIFGDPITKG